MVHLALPLLLGLATSSLNAASLPRKPSLGPLTSMNLTELYSSVTNITSLGDGGGIDPRFGIQYQLGDIPLRPIACLLNAVNAMTTLALQDFSGEILPIVASLSTYPDVVIRSFSRTILSPEPIPIRYILWGIWAFALYIMKNSAFQDMLLTLGFNEATVGFLLIEPQGARILSLAGSSDDDSAESVKRRSGVALHAIPPSEAPDIPTLTFNNTILSLTNTTTTFNAGSFLVTINAFGRSLTYQQFFIPIFAGLDYVARFPSSSPVDPFVVRAADTDTLIGFDRVRTRPGTEVPVFEYQWIAKALWELSRRISVAGVWSEATIGMVVDGVAIGTGWIRLG